MSELEKNIIAQWIEKADHDLIAAKILIEANPLILDIACFHCQQAIEKYLKVFLIYHNQEVIFTHNLDFLAQQCSIIDNDFQNIDMKNINQYAVKTRYPHDFLAPELSETKEYLKISEDIKQMVLSKIN